MIHLGILLFVCGGIVVVLTILWHLIESNIRRESSASIYAFCDSFKFDCICGNEDYFAYMSSKFYIKHQRPPVCKCGRNMRYADTPERMCAE